jgi:hypothetical protein
MSNSLSSDSDESIQSSHQRIHDSARSFGEASEHNLNTKIDEVINQLDKRLNKLDFIAQGISDDHQSPHKL